MTDPTRTRISASAMERIRNCPVSVKRSEGLQSKSSPESERGDEIHDYIRWHWLHNAGPGFERPNQVPQEPQPLIDDDRMRDAEVMIAKTSEILRSVEFARAQNWPLVWRVRFCETRLYWNVQTSGGFENISGVSDVVFTNKECDAAVIVDYKSGWGKYDSKTNDQLQTLAALTYLHSDESFIFVVIVKPTGNPEVACYGKDALKAACDRIEIDVRRAVGIDNPPVNPGKWCQYCPAMQNAKCPEAISAGLEVAEKAQGESGLKTREEITADIRKLTNEQLAAAAKRLKLAQVVCEVIKDEAKARLKAGEKLPGCSLKEGRKMRSIPDAYKAMRVAESVFGLTPGAFWQSVNVSPAQFENAMTACEISKPDRKRILQECGMVETRAEESLEVEP